MKTRLTSRAVLVLIAVIAVALVVVFVVFGIAGDDEADLSDAEAGISAAEVLDAPSRLEGKLVTVGGPVVEETVLGRDAPGTTLIGAPDGALLVIPTERAELDDVTPAAALTVTGHVAILPRHPVRDAETAALTEGRLLERFAGRPYILATKIRRAS